MQFAIWTQTTTISCPRKIICPQMKRAARIFILVQLDYKTWVWNVSARWKWYLFEVQRWASGSVPLARLVAGVKQWGLYSRHSRLQTQACASLGAPLWVLRARPPHKWGTVDLGETRVALNASCANVAAARILILAPKGNIWKVKPIFIFLFASRLSCKAMSHFISFCNRLIILQVIQFSCSKNLLNLFI